MLLTPFSNMKKKRLGVGLLALMLCCLSTSCASNTIGIIGGADGPTAIFVSNDTQIAEKLYKLKIQYVGSASDVGAIIGEIPIMKNVDGMELYTAEEPFGIGVYTYIEEISESEKEEFSRAAAMAMCLVGNCDVVRYVNRTSGAVLCEVTREEWDARLDKPLAEYASNYDDFKTLCGMVLGGEAVGDNLGTVIMEHNSGSYSDGECCAEGHIVLGSESSEKCEVYYLATTYGEYGFENGRLVKTSGTGVIPVRLTLAADGSVTEYREPMDGSGYLPSLKEMFPEKYVKLVQGDEEEKLYEQCIRQEKRYAQRYLASINRRDAKIGVEHDEWDELYKLDDMNTDASNTLLDLYYDYPYWLGTAEKTEDGIRYVYEKSWSSRGGGNGNVTYHKYRYDNGQTAEKIVLSVENGEISCIEGTPRTKSK